MHQLNTLATNTSLMPFLLLFWYSFSSFFQYCFCYCIQCSVVRSVLATVEWGGMLFIPLLMLFRVASKMEPMGHETAATLLIRLLLFFFFVCAHSQCRFLCRGNSGGCKHSYFTHHSSTLQSQVFFLQCCWVSVGSYLGHVVWYSSVCQHSSVKSSQTTEDIITSFISGSSFTPSLLSCDPSALDLFSLGGWKKTSSQH